MLPASVIAIPGLKGHRELTWTAGDVTLRLRDLLPAEVLHPRICTYGYNSRTHSHQSLIHVTFHEHATNLVSDLCLFRQRTGVSLRYIWLGAN